MHAAPRLCMPDARLGKKGAYANPPPSRNQVALPSTYAQPILDFLHGPDKRMARFLF